MSMMAREWLVVGFALLVAGCALDMEGEIESSDDLEEYADETGEDDDLENIEYVPSEYSSPNLLENPGFEEGGVLKRYAAAIYLEGWVGFFGTNASVTLVNAPHSGYRSIRVSDSDAGGTTYATGSASARAGASYELKAWTRKKLAGNCSQHLGVYFWSETQYLGRGPLVGTSSTSWTRLVTRFTAPAGTRWIAVNAGDFRGWGNCGTYDWDDFSLREI